MRFSFSLFVGAASIPREWAKLQASMPRYATSVGAAHPAANRYVDVLPFDKTRVAVAAEDDDDDHINASSITCLSQGRAV